jgi:hypothetical protein
MTFSRRTHTRRSTQCKKIVLDSLPASFSNVCKSSSCSNLLCFANHCRPQPQDFLTRHSSPRFPATKPVPVLPHVCSYCVKPIQCEAHFDDRIDTFPVLHLRIPSRVGADAPGIGVCMQRWRSTISTTGLRNSGDRRRQKRAAHMFVALGSSPLAAGDN